MALVQIEFIDMPLEDVTEKKTLLILKASNASGRPMVLITKFTNDKYQLAWYFGYSQWL